MVTVLGKDAKEVYRTICDCGCYVECEHEDLKHDYYLDTYSLKCPSCKRDILIRNAKQLKKMRSVKYTPVETKLV